MLNFTSKLWSSVIKSNCNLLRSSNFLRAKFWSNTIFFLSINFTLKKSSWSRIISTWQKNLKTSFKINLFSGGKYLIMVESQHGLKNCIVFSFILIEQCLPKLRYKTQFELVIFGIRNMTNDIANFWEIGANGFQQVHARVLQIFRDQHIKNYIVIKTLQKQASSTSLIILKCKIMQIIKRKCMILVLSNKIMLKQPTQTNSIERIISIDLAYTYYAIRV